MTDALFQLVGFIDRDDVMWSVGGPAEANPLLSRSHYLGPLTSGGHALIIIGSRHGEVVAAQVWRRPTSRMLPADGTWLELSRWCLTPGAGDNAGSRMHRYAVRLIRDALPHVTTLVSYSDPSQGHTGALYRACNWTWAPTWHRLRTPPTGNGAWIPGVAQAVKDRWVFAVEPDERRPEVLHIEDAAAIRHWRESATEAELRWAKSHPQLREAS
jgi:hypothetical protein